MSITDELRAWAARRLAGWKMLREEHDELTTIADRIDAAVDGMIELPKDADNVPIHVGDMMEWIGSSNPLPVTAISLREDGSWLIRINGCKVRPGQYRHHHAPAVEDVLREFANEVYADADNEIRDRDFLCAKYAKRLTLAEEEDA